MYDEADKTSESVKRANLRDAIGVYTVVLFHMQTNSSSPRNYGILDEQYYVGKRENNLTNCGKIYCATGDADTKVKRLNMRMMTTSMDVVNQ